MSGKECHKLVALFDRWFYSLVEGRREAGEAFDPDHEQPSESNLYLAAGFAIPPSAEELASALQRVRRHLVSYDGRSKYRGHALLDEPSWSKLTWGLEAEFEEFKGHAAYPEIESFGSVAEARAEVPGVQLLSPVPAG